MPKFCVKCGAPLEENAKFCVSCGATINNDNIKLPEKEIKPSFDAKSVENGQNNNPMRIIIGALLLMFVLSCGGYYYYTQHKETTQVSKSVPQGTKYTNEGKKLDSEKKPLPEEKGNSEKQTEKEVPNWHWIKDNNTGVYIWNPEPTEGESIVWNGGYVQDGDYRYADGAGIVTWYKNGKVIQVDEGAFIRGRHHGHFTHKFPSGKVKKSNWDNGREI